MDTPISYFVRDGDLFRSTGYTRGPWSPDLQHGGPPAALAARAVEALLGGRTPDGWHVARLSVEFVRPVPMAPLAVEAHVVRGGRKVQVLAASVAAALPGGAGEVLRATAVAIRRARLDFGEAATAPPPEALGAAGLAPPPPGRCAPFEFPFFEDRIGYDRSMEMRLARGALGRGAMAVWMRLRGEVVSGEAPSPLQRVVAAADSGNGVSVLLDPSRWTFINPDLTVYLRRPAEGEWVCLDAATAVDPIGVGLAETALLDARGPIGRSLQSLVIELRRDQA